MKLKWQLIIGIILFIFSWTVVILSMHPYFASLIHQTIPILLANIFFYVGLIMIFDWIDFRLSDNSLLHHRNKKLKFFWRFLLFSGLAILFLEGLMLWFGKYWYYPYFPTTFLFLVVYPLFFLYFLPIIESYAAIKAILDKIIGKKIVTKPFKFEKPFYHILGILGACLFSIGLTSIAFIYSYQGNFKFIVDRPTESPIPLLLAGMMLLAFWFLMEFVQWERKQRSFFKATIHGYLNPLLAIIIASVILSLLVELWNLPLGTWCYQNLLLYEIKLLGLPIVVWLGWPFQYIMFLSLYRALFKEVEEEVWK